MNCPNCGNVRTRVLDTDSNTGGDVVRRRRECQRCSFRLTTYERPEWDVFQVKKRDGSIEPYEQEKLRNGIVRAVEKRPVTDDHVAEILETVDAAVREKDERIIAPSLIGDLVSEQLRELDKVAYPRFVSVYKAFSEPEEFCESLMRSWTQSLTTSKPQTTNDASTHDAKSGSTARRFNKYRL